jgi:DNA-binding winged helix-turn-helix (wHTH) protein/tetratricopeptide (TPR) repeat protein
MVVRRFGVFDLDETTGELWRQGRRVHLAAQPFKVLALLTSRAGEIITRDELRHHLWSDGTFVEFDRSLNFCIAEVRRALGDDARSPRFVETVPKRGYRFIAHVHKGHKGYEGHQGIPDLFRRLGWAAVVPLLLMQQPMRLMRHTRASADPASLAAFQSAVDAGPSVAGRRRAIAALRTATRIDPRFAEAHYALADTYFDLAMKRELPIDAAIVEARAEAERAVALEDVAETRQLLGTIRLVADWDWPGARRDLSRAIALEPAWDFGLVAYARLLSAAGDDRAAIAAIDRAETLSPNCDLILFDAGQIYARAGRYDEALAKFERAVEFGPPRNTVAADWERQVRSRQFKIHLARRDWTAAHASAQAIVAASGASADAQRRFAAQDPESAIDAFLARSVSMTEQAGPREVVHLAGLESLRGNSATALTCLERAAAERDPSLVYALRDPEFDRLRAMPRYRALEARVRRVS